LVLNISSGFSFSFRLSVDTVHILWSEWRNSGLCDVLCSLTHRHFIHTFFLKLHNYLIYFLLPLINFLYVNCTTGICNVNFEITVITVVTLISIGVTREAISEYTVHFQQIVPKCHVKWDWDGMWDGKRGFWLWLVTFLPIRMAVVRLKLSPLYTRNRSTVYVSALTLFKQNGSWKKRRTKYPEQSRK
jgi:hypothetical protein